MGALDIISSQNFHLFAYGILSSSDAVQSKNLKAFFGLFYCPRLMFIAGTVCVGFDQSLLFD
jgi:hypothetical protein